MVATMPVVRKGHDPSLHKKTIVIQLKKQAMKRVERTTLTALIRLLMSAALTGIVLLTIPSCGNAKNGDANIAELAPPPPPPPPPVEETDSVFLKVDELPVFTGGDAALLKYVAKNAVYPQDAKMNKITGRVIVQLVVEKDGSVSNVSLKEGVYPSLDAEAVRVVGTLPKFEKPGIVNGKPVKVNYLVPISFTLN